MHCQFTAVTVRYALYEYMRCVVLLFTHKYVGWWWWCRAAAVNSHWVILPLTMYRCKFQLVAYRHILPVDTLWFVYIIFHIDHESPVGHYHYILAVCACMWWVNIAQAFSKILFIKWKPSLRCHRRLDWIKSSQI